MTLRGCAPPLGLPSEPPPPHRGHIVFLPWSPWRASGPANTPTSLPGPSAAQQSVVLTPASHLQCRRSVAAPGPSHHPGPPGPAEPSQKQHRSRWGGGPGRSWDLAPRKEVPLSHCADVHRGARRDRTPPRRSLGFQLRHQCLAGGSRRPAAPELTPPRPSLPFPAPGKGGQSHGEARPVQGGASDSPPVPPGPRGPRTWDHPAGGSPSHLCS